MAAKSGKPVMHTSTYPSAPDENQGEPPPPSYEESLKMDSTFTSAPQCSYSYPVPYQQQSLQHPHAYVSGPSHLAYGYANPYQMHIQQQQTFYHTLSTEPQLSTVSPTKNVLRLAKGAKIRTTASGAISIPPPPPGCAPTSGQMAVMAGQPVIVKKPKKTFF